MVAAAAVPMAAAVPVAAAVAAAPNKRKVSFGAEMSPAKLVVGWQGDGDDCSEAEKEESIYSEEESGSEAAEDEWWAQGGGGRRDSCFGGDFGDDAATLARAAAWRRENPELAEREAGRVLPPPLGQPRRRREEGDAAGARALARLQARVRHLRPRLHVAPRVPML